MSQAKDDFTTAIAAYDRARHAAEDRRDAALKQYDLEMQAATDALETAREVEA